MTKYNQSLIEKLEALRNPTEDSMIGVWNAAIAECIALIRQHEASIEPSKSATSDHVNDKDVVEIGSEIPLPSKKHVRDLMVEAAKRIPLDMQYKTSAQIDAMLEAIYPHLNISKPVAAGEISEYAPDWFCDWVHQMRDATDYLASVKMAQLIYRRLKLPEPVSVSLEKCAAAIDDITMNGNPNRTVAQMRLEQAKAALDVAGVRYAE